MSIAQTAAPFVFMAAGFGLSMVAHQQVDAARAADEGTQRVFIPSGEALRVTSLGYHTVLADILWIRAVLSFADIYANVNPEDAQWLGAMLDSIATLDPKWRTIYFHGGSMLRVIEDVDGSDALYQRGAEALPDEPYFEFSLAMNAYLYRQDTEAAAIHLDRAASIPGAPAWYRSASAGFMSNSGQRKAAIKYLQEQYESTTDPSVQDSLREKLKSLIHDEYADQITAMRDQRGAVPISELGALPADPFEEGWVVSAEGDVVSARIERDREEKAMLWGRDMMTNRTLWK